MALLPVSQLQDRSSSLVRAVALALHTLLVSHLQLSTKTDLVDIECGGRKAPGEEEGNTATAASISLMRTYLKCDVAASL